MQPLFLAESYVCDGEYDCNLSYWDNIENLMEDYPSHIHAAPDKTQN